MSTVAIIGVLATIAIPNYVKYQRKARQAEAKILLSSAYMAEQALFISETGNSYSACLGALGVAVDGTSYYAMGFTIAASITTVCGNNNDASPTSGVLGGPGGANATCNIYAWKKDFTSGKVKSSADCSPGGSPPGPLGQVFFVASQMDPRSGGGNYAPALPTDGGASGINTAFALNSLTWSSFAVDAAAGLGGAQLDKWEINEQKLLYQLQDGIN